MPVLLAMMDTTHGNGESRAVAWRDRAVRELSKRRIASEETAPPDLANAVGLKQAQLGNPEAL
jgi:hypothetical protein